MARELGDVEQTDPDCVHDAIELLSESRRGDLAEVAALAGAGADVNVATDRGHTPVLWATLEGNGRVVDLLLFARATGGVDNLDSPTPMEIAECQGCVGATDLLRSARSGEPGG